MVTIRLQRYSDSAHWRFDGPSRCLDQDSSKIPMDPSEKPDRATLAVRRRSNITLQALDRTVGRGRHDPEGGLAAPRRLGHEACPQGMPAQRIRIEPGGLARAFNGGGDALSGEPRRKHPFGPADPPEYSGPSSISETASQRSRARTGQSAPPLGTKTRAPARR